MFSSALYSTPDLHRPRESRDGVRKIPAVLDEETRDVPFMEGSVHKSTLVYLLSATQALLFMDRFTLYETWRLIRASLDLNHLEVASFVLIIYVVQIATAPVAGLLGDRVNRRLLVGWMLVAWVVGAFASSMDWGFAAFLIFRSLMALAETTFTTVSLPLIAELYIRSEQRRLRLILLFAAIPVGSGVGYVAGAFISYWANSWRWAMRMPAFAALLVAVVWRSVTRGESVNLDIEREDEDVKSHLVAFMQGAGKLARIPSYVLCSFGLASVLFVLERFNVFAPAILKFKSYDPHGMRIRISFGLSVCLGSLATLAFGVRLAEAWRRKAKSRILQGVFAYKADLTLCALLLAAVIPLVYGTLSLLGSYIVVEWLLIAAVVFMLCLSFGVAIDILMDIVPTTRRALATGLQTLLALLIETAMFVAFTLVWPSTTFASTFRDIITQLVVILSAGAVSLLFAARFVERDWRVHADEIQLLSCEQAMGANDYT